MATESIGRTVHLTDEQFVQIVEAMKEVDANPPKPRKSEIVWGDPKEIAQRLERKYADAK